MDISLHVTDKRIAAVVSQTCSKLKFLVRCFLKVWFLVNKERESSQTFSHQLYNGRNNEKAASIYGSQISTEYFVILKCYLCRQVTFNITQVLLHATIKSL